MTRDELGTHIKSNLQTDPYFWTYIGSNKVADEIMRQTKTFLTGLTTYEDVFRKMSKSKISNDSTVFVFSKRFLDYQHNGIENNNKDPIWGKELIGIKSHHINSMTFFVVPKNLRLGALIPFDDSVTWSWGLSKAYRSVF